MDSSYDSAIESTPPPAVSSLRSKFELLAASPPRTHLGFLSPEPSSPRPRAVSGSQEARPQYGQLRSASSSSDLRTGSKRPPPPPPRGAKPVRPSSPALSPLLRPVPIPNSSPSLPSISLLSSSPGTSPLVPICGDNEVPSQGGVASLRTKFLHSPVVPPSRTVTPTHTPRQSLTNIHPIYYSEQEFPDLRAPALPPRHAETIDLHNLSVRSTPSLEQIVSSGPTSPRIALQSPFSADDNELGLEETDPPVPPSIPPRRNRSPAVVPNGPIYPQKASSESAMSSSSSIMFTESDASAENHLFTVKPVPPSRPSVVVPPRPPPRPKIHRTIDKSDSPSSASSTQTPPPLPVRRAAASPLEGAEQPPPPRLPNRPAYMAQEAHAVSSYPTLERKPVGLGRLPPPPTRTIALGEKLPPARRPPTPSTDEDSGDETDSKSGSIDQLPDSSRSSRRPPVLTGFKHSDAKIPVPAHSGQVAVSGPYVVVVSHHHLKIYDLTISDLPMSNLDTRSLHMKDSKITSLEFRSAEREDDRGYFLWIGTKEGHLFEVDIRSGSLTASKFAAHGHCVTHIFRHARSMITLDSNGKVLIFTTDLDGNEDVHLIHSQPRVFRIAEKQEFVKFLGGLLWTSTRADMTGSGPTSKAPIIRVYDIFTPGSVGRSIAPIEYVGAVTSGSIVPSQPHNVYLGHEGGFISIWSILASDGVPQCIEVMKVAVSDVLSLEGVGERLWAGGRKGMISAYDVVPRPWLVTNCWNAHSELPVLRLAIDPYSIERLGQLCVVSVGRDEQARLWDGLLASDWIDQELLKREKSFSTFRELDLLVISWNIDAAKPDALDIDATNTSFLQEVLNSVNSPDIISFGFQEVIDLESRKMAAKTVLLGGKKKGQEEGKISEKVTSAYKRWHDRLVSAVRSAMPPNASYTVIETENLVGLFSCIFIKTTERISIKDIAITTIKRGMGGRYGNKGGILARFTIDDTSICMINCHLAAGQHHVKQRNADVAAMIEEKSVFPPCSDIEDLIAYVGGGDGSMVLDHEIVFVNGDMNYRIDYRRDAIIAAVQSQDLGILVTHDQLTKEMKFNRGFRFRSFLEGPLTFSPTYKYDRNSWEYDTSDKRRKPSWCDRILWCCRDLSRVKQLHYRRWEANVSDHRPISAGFTITIKSVRHELRAIMKAEVQAGWIGHQRALLLAARQYYVDQALI